MRRALFRRAAFCIAACLRGLDAVRRGSIPPCDGLHFIDRIGGGDAAAAADGEDLCDAQHPVFPDRDDDPVADVDRGVVRAVVVYLRAAGELCAADAVLRRILRIRLKANAYALCCSGAPRPAGRGGGPQEKKPRS